MEELGNLGRGDRGVEREIFFCWVDEGGAEGIRAAQHKKNASESGLWRGRGR